MEQINVQIACDTLFMWVIFPLSECLWLKSEKKTYFRNTFQNDKIFHNSERSLGME